MHSTQCPLPRLRPRALPQGELNLFFTLIAGTLIAGSLCLPAVAAPPGEVPPQLEMLAPGVRLSKVAEHPAVVTPTGIDIDDQGTIWVVASHTHFRPDDYDGPRT